MIVNCDKHPFLMRTGKLQWVFSLGVSSSQQNGRPNLLGKSCLRKTNNIKCPNIILVMVSRCGTGSIDGNEMC